MQPIFVWLYNLHSALHRMKVLSGEVLSLVGVLQHRAQPLVEVDTVMLSLPDNSVVIQAL